MVLQVLTSTTARGGDAQVVTRTVNTQGFTQVLDPRDLDIKMEGIRKWKAQTLYLLTDPSVKVNDKVKLSDGITYRVMSAWDYSQFGWYKYTLLEDFRIAA